MSLFKRGPQGPRTYTGQRLPMIAGNWKMNKTMDEAIELVQQVSYGIEPKYDQCEVVICPPFTDIRSARVVLMTDNSPVRLAAQDVHPAPSGAYTGCISAAMIASLGCRYCIVGHSERREYFGETDADVAAKIAALRQNGLYPIMCCGESLEVRDAGQAIEFVTSQVRAGMAGMEAKDVEQSVIAYEPIWAIGTGRTATPDQAQEVCAAIRATVRGMFGNEAADSIRILYGGSMNPGNVDKFMPMADIDGGLIGGASLKHDSFLSLVHAAQLK